MAKNTSSVLLLRVIEEWQPLSPFQLETIRSRLDLSCHETAQWLVLCIGEYDVFAEVDNHIHGHDLHHLTPEELMGDEDGECDSDMLRKDREYLKSLEPFHQELEHKGYIKFYFWGDPPRKYTAVNYELILRKLFWTQLWPPGYFSSDDEMEFKEIEDKSVRDKERRKTRLVAWLRSIPYEEYLKTKHWSLVRQRALLRAGFHCQLCFKKTSLQVHHLTYERRGWEDEEDLIVLCDKCHARHHGILPKGGDA